MDQGPFRMSRPTDRKVAARPDQAQRRPTTPEPAKQPPASASPAGTPQRASAQPPSSPKRFLLPIAAVIITALITAGAFVWMNQRATSTAIDSSKYQAVFFTNGQVYFGKLQARQGEYMKLTDIYYLQSQQPGAAATDSENPQATSSDKSNVQLIKLGDEIHGPEDAMYIAKDQMLFYENLKTDGKVSQSIAQYKKP